MKTLIFNGDEFHAEKIIKIDTDIVGYNGNKEAFAFRGISDFSFFALSDGQLWDEEVNEMEKLKGELATMQGVLDFIIMNY